MFEKYDGEYLVLSSDENVKISNEGYWLLYSGTDRRQVEKFCKKLIKKNLLDKCAFTDRKDGNVFLSKFYTNGKDKIANAKLLSYLIENNYIVKIGKKLYADAAYYFVDSKKQLNASDFIDLTTGKSYK